jgi:hypothetical protein
MEKRVTLFIFSFFLFFSSMNLFAQAPLITQEPVSKGVIEGQTATFSVNVTGDTLTFVWFKNGVVIGGSDSSVYTTPPTVLGDNGAEFKVVVSNSYGTDTSVTAKLYVTGSGSRVSANQIVAYLFDERTGNKVNDVAGLSPALNLTIENTTKANWQAIEGLHIKDSAYVRSTDAAAISRVVNAIKTNNEMTAELWIRSLDTEVNSKLISLSRSLVDVDFEIENLSSYNGLVRTTTTNLRGAPGVYDGAPAVLEARVQLVLTHKNGVSKIYRDGVEVASSTIGGNLSNWTDAVGTVLMLGSNNGFNQWEGVYYHISIYSRGLDSVEVAHNYSLGSLRYQRPFVIEHPKSTQVFVGDSVSFKCDKIVGNTPYFYNWQKNGIPIDGATNAVYTIYPATLADNGAAYRVVVTNGLGADTSDNAILSVGLPPVGTPTNLAAYQDSANFRHVKLTWVDNSTNELGFKIERKTGDSASVAPFTLLDSVSANVTSYKDTTVAGSTTYTYRVFSYNASLVSGYSNMATVTTILFTVAAPTNLAAVNNPADTHFVKLTWNDNSSNETGFILERKTGDIASVAPFTVINTLAADVVSFVDSSVAEFTTYTYRLKAFNLYIESDYSNMSSVTTPLFSVPAPTNLIAFASPADSHNVRLMWTDNSPNELGFVIQRKTGDSLSAAAFTNIAIVVADITIYEDTWVDDSTTYTYRVYAFKIDGASQYSNLAQILTVVPVELSTFTANIVSGQVQINWETATEVNNSGFTVQRSKDNSKFIDLNFVKGQGTTTFQSSYSYIDKSVLSGKYYYRLKQVDFNGSANYSKSIEVDLGVPKEYVLEQNYPNPFNPSTTIRFALPMNANVTIKLYNTLGQEVSTLLNADLEAGIHETVFNASTLSSGVYFYSLKVKGVNGSDFTSTKRMILMK